MKSDAQSTDSSQARPKHPRKQGVSCDACKFRKVRCDLRYKIENKDKHVDENEISCSVCSQHGLRCTFTQSITKQRRGKRIMAIQKQQLEEQDHSLAQRSLEEESRQLIYLQDREQSFFGKHEFLNVPLTIPIATHMETGNAFQPSVSQAPMTTPTGLFGVRGLTRALLDACTRSYFKFASPCQPILHVEVFSARYALFFALYEEFQRIPKTEELPPAGADDRPLSVLLMLAVGCVGAALLEPPIAEKGSKAKFRLQDRMALRFREVMNEMDLVVRLKLEGTDVIEACYIMADPSLKILGDDDSNNTSAKAIDWDRVVRTPIASSSLLNPLRMSPSSTEAVVRLIFKMSINRRPKRRENCPLDDPRKWVSGGVFLTEKEVFRRVRVFWSAFIQDSFRSMGMRSSLLIGDDDYDLDLPRIIPRGDGFYTALLFYDSQREHDNDPLPHYSPYNEPLDKDSLGPDPRPAAIYLQPARFARFDALQLEVMLRLAFIIRTVSIRFVSQRAQGRGVLISDVERATASLNAWSDQLPHDVRWEAQSPPLLNGRKEGDSSTSQSVALRNSIKTLFIETLFCGNVLTVWSSVKDFGVRFEVDLTEAVHLFAQRLGLEDQKVGINLKKEKPNVPFGEESTETEATEESKEQRKQMALRKLDALAIKSFLRMAHIASEAGKADILRASRSVFLNVSSACIVWGCEFAQRTVREPIPDVQINIPPNHDFASYILASVEQLITAVSTIDSYESINDVVGQLTVFLRIAREECRKARAQDPLSAASYHSDNSYSASSSSLVGRYLSFARSQDTTPSSSSTIDERSFSHGFSALSGSSVEDSPPASQFSKTNTVSPPDSRAAQVDEVSLLARAAVPDTQGQVGRTSEDPQPLWPSQSSAKPSFLHASHPIIDDLYGAALNHDLESIGGMDTRLLQRYLSDGPSTNIEGGQRPTNPPISNLPIPQSISTSPMASLATSRSFVESTQPENEGGRMGPSASDMSYGSMNFFNSDITNGWMDQELIQNWDQLMNNVCDAQVWAESQWQGFSFPSQ